jgi:hypothetical protein
VKKNASMYLVADLLLQVSMKIIRGQLQRTVNKWEGAILLCDGQLEQWKIRWLAKFRMGCGRINARRIGRLDLVTDFYAERMTAESAPFEATVMKRERFEVPVANWLTMAAGRWAAWGSCSHETIVACANLVADCVSSGCRG